jgi:hypothetical protein
MEESGFFVLEAVRGLGQIFVKVGGVAVLEGVGGVRDGGRFCRSGYFHAPLSRGRIS